MTIFNVISLAGGLALFLYGMSIMGTGLEKYAGGPGKKLCGWVIKSAEKFDTPSPLAEFGLDRPPMSWQYVEIPDGMEAEHE